MRLLSYTTSLAVLFLALHVPAHPALASAVTGILVPLYADPDSTWDDLVAAKNAHPSVPIVAIINPNNGPGNATIARYVSGIQNLTSSGISVMGYVHTNYTSRDPVLVKNDIASYKSWYPQITGIFFDEMSNAGENESYYMSLSQYAKSLGVNFTVGNTGVDTLPSYVGTVDNIVIHDNSWLPGANFLSGWHTWYDKSNFSLLSYGVEALDQTYVRSAANYVGYLYVSGDIMPNPWDSLPAYFDSLVGSVGGVFSIRVNSVNVSTVPIHGVWSEIYSNDTIVRSGFTPAEYLLVSGLPYKVCVSDYQNNVFDHWDAGNTDRCVTTTLAQNVTLTAYYVPYSTLNLHTVELNGTAVSGMRAEIYSNGTKIQSGFTPQSYHLLSNSPYVVCVSGYQNYTFDHWDDGGAGRCRMLVLADANHTVTAYYKP